MKFFWTMMRIPSHQNLQQLNPDELIVDVIIQLEIYAKKCLDLFRRNKNTIT